MDRHNRAMKNLLETFDTMNLIIAEEPSREISLAKTKLQETMFWLVDDMMIRDIEISDAGELSDKIHG